MNNSMISAAKVYGARVHNLKNIDVEVPLNCITGIAGVSGSGKSSLALGVLYAEGSRRYLESLSTYTRRRMTAAPKANVDEVLFVPSALALHQRPGIPGIRSTFGTGTELLNILRLMYSRLGRHRCPNGHYLEPTLAVAAEQPINCPECGEIVRAPSAEELAFNSQGVCPACAGTGIRREVDRDTLVPDESLSIEEGAVAPWRSLMWSLMVDVARAMGVRTDVPFHALSQKERDIVFDGPAEKKHIVIRSRDTGVPMELDFTFYSAVHTVENALAKVKDESGMKRVEKFLKQVVCPECGGSRLSDAARAPRLRGIGLDAACRMPLGELAKWVDGVPDTMPASMRPMAENICQSFREAARLLLELGLEYLALERSAVTLSTGERQRMQLARAVRNRTTGVLYVLDEPSIGLHPANARGLEDVMRNLVADGNSVVLVDHDMRILEHADYIIEMGPGAGAKGGTVIAQGTVAEMKDNPHSLIGPYLSGKAKIEVHTPCSGDEVFANGAICLETLPLHTVRALKIAIPKGRLTAVTGVSGSGKTTMALESLVPALEALDGSKKAPAHVAALSAEGIERVKLIDATPIGANARSTVATYADIHDYLRKLFAGSRQAKERKLKAGAFSYNTGSLRCPLCDGTGQISLDVQFLPDVEITCPQCRGTRYGKLASEIYYTNKAGARATMPELMAMDICDALEFCKGAPAVRQRLDSLAALGLGYLRLGEATPSLSGGEAQRLKLASEMGRVQETAVFVFDEPTIGLHPLDVKTLLEVFQKLLDLGATVIVIEHDRDVIVNCDYIIDMGPGGGEAGGRVVASGTLGEIKANPASVTGKFL